MASQLSTQYMYIYDGSSTAYTIIIQVSLILYNILLFRCNYFVTACMDAHVVLLFRRCFAYSKARDMPHASRSYLNVNPYLNVLIFFTTDEHSENTHNFHRSDAAVCRRKSMTENANCCVLIFCFNQLSRVSTRSERITIQRTGAKYKPNMYYA